MRCVRKCGISTQWLVNFYRGTIESILSGDVTVWYGNTPAKERKATQRVVRTAEKIIWFQSPVRRTRTSRFKQFLPTGSAPTEQLIAQLLLLFFLLLDYWTIIALTITLDLHYWTIIGLFGILDYYWTYNYSRLSGVRLTITVHYELGYIACRHSHCTVHFAATIYNL